MKAEDIYDPSATPHLPHLTPHIIVVHWIPALKWKNIHIPRLSYQEYQEYQLHSTLASAVEEKDWEIWKFY